MQTKICSLTMSYYFLAAMEQDLLEQAYTPMASCSANDLHVWAIEDWLQNNASCRACNRACNWSLREGPCWSKLLQWLVCCEVSTVATHWACRMWAVFDLLSCLTYTCRLRPILLMNWFSSMVVISASHRPLCQGVSL